MTQVHEITWREVTGNKFNRGLHPAMLSDDKYCVHLSMKRLGDTQKSLFEVVYDEEYVLAWMSCKVCHPLNRLSKEEILDLVGKAYDLNYRSDYLN